MAQQVITCPHCGASWVYVGNAETTTESDDEWLDWHFIEKKCLEDG